MRLTLHDNPIGMSRRLLSPPGPGVLVPGLRDLVAPRSRSGPGTQTSQLDHLIARSELTPAVSIDGWYAGLLGRMLRGQLRKGLEREAAAMRRHRERSR